MPQLRRYVVTAVMQSGTFLETINNKYWAVIVDLEIWVHGLFTFIHEYILYFIQSLCSLFMKSWKLRGYYVTMMKWGLKLDRWVEYENGPFWYTLTFILIFLTINWMFSGHFASHYSAEDDQLWFDFKEPKY